MRPCRRCIRLRTIRQQLAALAIAMAISCSRPATSPAPVDPHEAAVAALERETGATWRVRWRPDLNTPALLDGQAPPLLGPTGRGAEAAARGFVFEHPDLFHLDRERDDLLADSIEVDELGMVHVRLARKRQGLPVWGDGANVHFDGRGALFRLEARLTPLQALVHLVPTVTGQEAAATASGAAGPLASAQPPNLVVDPAPGAASSPAAGRLAWRIEVSADDPPSRHALFVDATSGEAYRREELLDSLRGSGIGVFGDRQDLEVASRGGRFFLEDATRGDPVQRIYSARNGSTLPGSAVASDRLDRWDEGGAASGVAVDAAAYVAASWEYFARVHGRNGASGRGEGMHATVHFGSDFPAAFWNGGQLVFGDGDGRVAAPLAGALDVVAHEFAHAVIGSTASLGHAGEQGALNEGIADLFACFVEREIRGADANWSVGEAVLLDGAAGLRDLSNPGRLGTASHVSDERHGPADRGEVHANATIVGHAGYLMAVGGGDPAASASVGGVGVTLAERIWFRALTRYLGRWSGYQDAAEATVAAARDLTGEGSPAVQATVLAWRAVGLTP